MWWWRSVILEIRERGRKINSLSTSQGQVHLELHRNPVSKKQIRDVIQWQQARFAYARPDFSHPWGEEDVAKKLESG